MNRFTTFLMTGLLLFCANFAIAQGPTFSITPQSQAVTAGSTVTFTISVSNFNNIEGFQYSMSWDATKLTYSSISDITLQGLTAGSFSTSGTAVSWVTPTGGPINAATGSIYKMNFTAATTGTVAIGFVNVPTAAEVIGSNGNDLTAGTSFNPALGTTGTGTGGGGNTCGVPSGITTTPANTTSAVSWNAITGATSYKVEYKATTSANWISATTSTPNFNIPGLAVCTDYQVQVQAVCASGSSTFSSPVSFKTTGCSTGGGGGGTGTNCWTCNSGNISGFGLILSDAYAPVTGNETEMTLHATGFNKIEGMQFEIKWDPTKLEYKGNTPVLAGLTAGGLNVDAANGRIGLTWTDPNAVGLTLSDCAEILKIKFKVLGAANATASVWINPNGNPNIEITANAKEITVPASNLVAGNVIVKTCTTGPPPPVNCNPAVYDKTLNFTQVVGESLNQVCIDLIANSFTNIDGVQTGIRWDANKLTFLAVKVTGLTDMNASHYNVNTGDGTMALSYTSANSNGFTVPNGTSLFQICFTVAMNNGSSDAVKFDPNILALEVTSNSTVIPSITTQNGKVVASLKPIATIKEMRGACGNTASGELVVEPAGTNFSYAWTGPNGYTGTGQNIKNLKDGAYRVTVTDNTTCLSTETTGMLSKKTIPNITKLEQVNDCIDLENTGGIAPFTYKWSNNITTQDLCNVQSGIYKVTVTNSDNCQKDTLAAFIVAKSTVVNAKCGKDGKIEFTDNTLDYKWNIPGVTGPIANNLGKGSYTVTISTIGTPSAKTIQTVTVNGPDSLDIKTVSTTAPPNAQIDIDVNGGTGTLKYLWSNNATTQDITGLALGNYTVTVTDANNCTSTKTVSVNCSSLSAFIVPTSDIKVKNTTCGLNNGSIIAIAKGGSSDYIAKWSNNVTATTTTVTDLAAGFYNITVSDKNCLSSVVVTGVEVKASQELQAQLDQAIDAKDNCSGAITLKLTNATGTPTFTWKGNTPVANTVQNPTNLCEGWYYVTITDAQPCTDTLSIYLKGVAALTVDDGTTKVANTTCPSTCDGQITLETKGGKSPYTYLWSNNKTTKDIANLCQGKYSVTITDNSGKTVTKSFDIKTNSKLDATVKITAPVPNNAKNGAAVAQINDGVAPYKYLWSNGATTNQINNLSAGIYTITITDANGCTLVKTEQVGDIGAVEIVIRTNFNGTNIRCFGMCNGIAEVKSVPGSILPLTYRWSNGDTSSIAKGLCVGTHKVIVTDAKKEQFEGVINILGPDKIEIDIKTTDATNGTDGAAEARIKGGTAPFLYRWHNDAGTSVIANQPKGRVFIMVTDANGCEAFKDGFVGPIGVDVPCLTAIPVITPNSDGYNDYLDIYCLELYPQNKLEVFNRYGQVVFEQENYINRTWQPTDANGNPLPDGGYFYVINVTNANGSKTNNKGSFNIVSER